jgi:hypothetical protein
MVDLAEATNAEISAELTRRKECEMQSEIDQIICEIAYLHKQHKIARIYKEESRTGTCLATTKYFIHLK